MIASILSCWEVERPGRPSKASVGRWSQIDTFPVLLMLGERAVRLRADKLGSN